MKRALPLILVAGCDAYPPFDLEGVWLREASTTVIGLVDEAAPCTEELQRLELMAEGHFAYRVDAEVFEAEGCSGEVGLTTIEQSGDWAVVQEPGELEYRVLVLAVSSTTTTTPDGDTDRSQRRIDTQEPAGLGESLDGRRLLRLENLGLFWEAE